jgi:anti-sigma B factor antagonist
MFEERKDGGIVILKIDAPQFNASIAPEFKRKVGEIVARGDRSLVIDLEPIEFIDSTALGALVSGLKAVAPDGQLALCGANPTVQAMLQITRMEKVLKAYPDAATARDALLGVAG